MCLYMYLIRRLVRSHSVYSMAKRPPSPQPESVSRESKRQRRDTGDMHTKIATAHNAAAVDAHPPLQTLLDAAHRSAHESDTGSAVVYWMRMQDMRSTPHPVHVVEKRS